MQGQRHPEIAVLLTTYKGSQVLFFQLIESVEAEIYLFCDQDDIWQPGKIDATAADTER